MSVPNPQRVAALYLERKGHVKTAGEVVFKKDRGDDVGSWAYNDVAPSKREIPTDFNYSPRHQKPLAKILRATLAALGHTLSGYNKFAKIKSARVSPDGSLGGRGYIQRIADMRKQYMNCVEALSALADTIYDELNAPHWSVVSRQEEDEEKEEVKALIGDAETIRQDPQSWAEEEMQEEFGRPSDKPELTDPDDWDAWGDELENETTVIQDQPDMQAPVFQRTANKSVRQIRLEVTRSRVAKLWLAKHKDQLPGGLADKKEPSDFDPEQLRKGIKVEMEHTDDRAKAEEIAMDHLTEDAKYYDKLEKVEGGHD